MGTSDDFNVAVRYRTIRKHLDTLGYKQALSLDALPLIEVLLADLIQTTESLKHFKSTAQEYIEKCSELQLAVDPYKCDNTKLVQECNQLHSELVETKEAYQKQTNDLKKQLRKVESEYADLQLTSSRNLQRIKELEAESAKKSKKILELQGKCCKPIINNAALGTKKRSCYPLRRPILECEPTPRTTSSSISLPSNRTTDPYIVDFVNMADQRISSLNCEVNKLKSELSLQTDTINTLHSQLIHKEKEILRLRKMLEGGRPYSAVSTDCYCTKSKNHEMHDVLESSEIRVLQQAKSNLEQQLKDALDKQHEAMTQAMRLAERNEILEKELKDIDHIALAVEADCTTAVREKDRKVSRMQEKLDAMTTQVHVLENELITARREVQELKADLESSRQERRNMQRMLESTLDEKKRMTDKINELTIMVSKAKERSTSSPARDKECQSTTHIEEFAKEHSELRKLQNKILTLETERDFYRNEYMKLKEQFYKETEKDNSSLWNRNRELKQQLMDKERVITEMLHDKEELVRDKKNLEIKLQRFMSQRQDCSACSPCNSQPISCTRHTSCERDYHTMKLRLERAERERDTAKADVERLIEERDALHKRLQMATEAHLSEQRRLRENLTDVETRLKKVECERNELRMAQGTRRVTIDSLEEEVKDLTEELRRTKQELSDQRTQYFQLRTLQDQTDQALGDIQGQLTQSEAELSRTMDRNKGLEQQNVQLDKQMKDLKQEINTLRTNMAQLDREKDHLLVELDEKTEKIVSMEKELHYKEQRASTLEQQIRDLEYKNQICIDQRADQDRHMRNMQMDLENLQRQLATATMDRENAIHENRRLQDDLAAVTCEVRNLQREIDLSRAESSDLKRQLQTYVSEVRRAEDLLNMKEHERAEMLERFKSLSLEANVLETSNHSLESEAAEARGALRAAKEQLLDAERQLSNKDCLIKGYESQIAELTQRVASLETQLRQQTDQRQRAEADLNAVRDLCVKLDQQKDSLMQQLDEKTTLKTQYETQLERLRTEQSVIQDQMSRDHTAVNQLEDLLSRARQEAIEAQTTNQELQNEISRLKRKISELQCKLTEESAELRQYQNQAVEYSRQINELRRQVTNERFDRARKDEETRRSLNSTPDSFNNVDLNVVI